MKPTRTILTACALLAVAGCSDNPAGPEFPAPDGMTRIYLTDAPFPYDQVDRVDVFIVSIAATVEPDTGAGVDERDWVTIATPGRSYNLLDLRNGTVELIGEAELSAGAYRAVRVVIDASNSSMTGTDGGVIPITWNDPQGDGTGLVTVFALVEGALDVPTEGANIVLDFDVGRSFITHGQGPTYLFVPWIRAVNQATTGSITGVVRGSDGPQESLRPVPRASITVYNRSACPPEALCTTALAPVASGATDAQGRYTIHYLPAGRYMVVADPPADFDAGSGVRDTIPVAAGEESVVDIFLPPSGGSGGQTGARLEVGGDRQVDLGDSTFFNAVVFSEEGDSVLNRDVTWSTTNAAVAAIVSTANGFAVVRGLSLGTSDIIARSGELADTAVVTVVEPQELGPVATVQVFPQNISVTVDDTLFVGVTLRDAQGHVITDRGVAWSITPGGVLRLDGSGPQALFLTAVGAGTAVVRAEVEGKSDSTAVTVTN